MSRAATAVATVAALFVVLAAGPGRAESGLALALPVDCALGERCFVQHYPDVGGSGDARDFTCGPLTYDGHKGTDIRLRNLDDMRAGIDVVAAAAGRVRRVRDGEPDLSVRERGPDSVAGRECGNGVVLAHGGGWETQYCHMKAGSIAVRPGERVAAGTVLGEVGLSGLTEFPHLHFEVRRGAMPVDPFTGHRIDRGCGARPIDPLWTAAARQRLAYRPSGVLNAGFSTDTPSMAEIEDDPPAPEALPAHAPAIVFWVEIFGLRSGDVHGCRLLGPSGEALAEPPPERSDRDRAVLFRFVGLRRPAERWPPGRYVGEFWLKRPTGDGLETVLRERRTILVR